MNIKISERVVIFNGLHDQLKKDKKIKQKLKGEWIKNQRKNFNPSAKKDCDVCGKYKDVSEAHHLAPLYIQYERKITPCLQNHVWLCPTHHKIVHLVINNAFNSKEVELNIKSDEKIIVDKIANEGVSLIFGEKECA